MKKSLEEVETGPGDHYIKLGRKYKRLGNAEAAARFIACGEWINELWTSHEHQPRETIVPLKKTKRCRK